MNKVVLTGNIVREVELKHGKDGLSMLANAICIDGDRTKRALFFDFIAFGQQADFLSKYASKGCKILIDGRLSVSEFERKDGSKGSKTEIVAERVEVFNRVVETEQEQVKETKPKQDTEDIDEADLPW